MATQKTNTKAVNCLLKKLEGAIASGNHQQAAGFAKELATLRVQCSVKRHRPKNYDLLNVDMYIEDRLAHQGPIPLQVPLLMTVAQLKEKISTIFDIPANVQRWTINNKVADDNDATLDDLHAVEGSPVFLYLVAPNLQMFNRVKRPRIEQDPNNFNHLTNNNSNDMVNTDDDGDDNEDLHERDVGKSEDNINHDKKKLTESDDENEVIPIELVPVVDNPAAFVEATNNEHELPEDYKEKEASEKINEVIEDKNKPGVSGDNKKVPEIEAANENVQENSIELVEKDEQKEYHELMMLASCEVVANTDFFTCPICFSEYGPYEGIRLHECLHAFCRDCLVNTIKHCDDPLVKCPYVDDDYACTSLILEREIRALVDPHVFEAHLSKSMTQAESCAGENAFHCKTPDCNGWCFYDADRYHFSCPKCEKTNCLMCKVIHEGKSCIEYQEEVLIATDPNHASNLTQAALDDLIVRGAAMKCPTCSVVIMKKMGCDALECIMCKTEICWATKGPRWGPRGRGDTSGGCRCKVNGRFCHPSCQGCH